MSQSPAINQLLPYTSYTTLRVRVRLQA